MATFTGSNEGDVADAGSGQLLGFTTGTLAELQDTTGDTINGLGGNDLIVAGAGNDTIDAGAASPGQGFGFDVVIGGEGDDVINVDIANAATTIVAYVPETGGAGISVDLSTDTATDTFGDTDTLNGAVFIVATNDNDTLIGDTTDDTFAPGRGTDLVDGGGGFDTLDYYFVSDGQGGGTDGFNFTTGITVNMTGEDAGAVTSADGVDTTFTNVEFIAGTRFADVFNGGTGDDGFQGGAGNDTFNGGDGTDYVQYALDYIGGGLAGVTVNLAAGTGIDPFGDTDTFNNIENITGTQFADSLTGDGGNNDLKALDGNDFIDGGAGNDIIDAGTASPGQGLGFDVVIGGEGDDVINVDIANAETTIVAYVPETGGAGISVDLFRRHGHRYFRRHRHAEWGCVRRRHQRQRYSDR